MRRAVALAIVTALAPPTLAQTAASAPVPPSRLVYTAGPFAPQCPELAAVRAGVVSRLGVDPFAEPAERVVVITIEGDSAIPGAERPRRARIELFDADLNPIGARLLDSDEGCAELVLAAALAASIALSPERALAAGPTAPPEPVPLPPEDPAAPLPVEAPIDDEVVTIEDARAPPPPWLPDGTVLLVGTGGGWSFLLGPATSGGPLFSAAGRNGPWELRAELRNHVGLDVGIGSVHGAVAGTVLPCAHVPLFGLRGDGDALGVQGCLTGTTALVWSLGGYLGASPYVGAGARFGAEWVQPDHAAFRVFSQLELALFRPIYVDVSGGPALEQGFPINVQLGVTWEMPILP